MCGCEPHTHAHSNGLSATPTVGTNSPLNQHLPTWIQVLVLTYTAALALPHAIANPLSALLRVPGQLLHVNGLQCLEHSAYMNSAALRLPYSFVMCCHGCLALGLSIHSTLVPGTRHIGADCRQ